MYGVNGHGSERFDGEITFNLRSASTGQAMVVVGLLREAGVT